MKVLIIGGAGFVGANTAARFIRNRHKVTILDNLSRRGTKENIEWLKRKVGRCDLFKADIREHKEVKRVFARQKYDAVIHLAAQVAVTTSVTDPREDFEINALGTFNVLEAIRESGRKPAVIFASTNKVYGGMEHIKVVKRQKRYQYRDLPKGIDEKEVLDFHSPYGCSKGAADQYVRDYARIYEIPTVVFRQSCIYGYRQFGIEDQGWVAWFTIAAALGKRVTVYGDGMQVRDVLFIEDLVDAYELAIKNIKKISGRIYNVGGGPKNQMSLLELIAFLEKFTGKKLKHQFDDWRPGDQPCFVCNIDRARKDFGWKPKTTVEKGVRQLYDWVSENQEMLQRVMG